MVTARIFRRRHVGRMRIEIAYGQKEWITIASAVDEPQGLVRVAPCEAFRGGPIRIGMPFGTHEAVIRAKRLAVANTGGIKRTVHGCFRFSGGFSASSPTK